MNKRFRPGDLVVTEGSTILEGKIFRIVAATSACVHVECVNASYPQIDTNRCRYCSTPLRETWVVPSSHFNDLKKYRGIEEIIHEIEYGV